MGQHLGVAHVLMTSSNVDQLKKATGIVLGWRVTLDNDSDWKSISGDQGNA
ncbi:hypothetical protein AB1L30_13835 [Bremerella sp. JC817]|uniref:hypothetical protein n=1 Tax=Bremerella sp. JC817 TaxID=3231756 RepID=UPI0034579D51